MSNDFAGLIEVPFNLIGLLIRTFYWFIKGQTYFGMPRGAKMSLA